MTTYTKADEPTLTFVGHVMDRYHWRLRNAGVTVSVLMAAAPTDEQGDAKGCAIKVHGVPALAKIRIVGLRDRVEGLADAEMIIDGDRWTFLEPAERVALVDHELTHLMLVLEDGRSKRDDHGRPKLRLRPHDHEFGWFAEVAERHGKHSQEVQQARQLVEGQRQAYFAFLDAPVVTVDEKAQVAA